MIKKWALPEEIAGIELQLAVNWLVWLGKLPPESVDKVSSRLRLPAVLKAGVVATTNLMAVREKILRSSPSQLVDSLEHYPLLAVFVAFLISNDPGFSKKLETYALKLRHVHPGLDGGDLIRMGLKPSPRFKLILGQLRAAWLDGRVKSSAEEKKLLDELLAGNDSHDERRKHVLIQSLSQAGFEKVILRHLRSDDLPALEWDGVYTRFRKLYQSAFERSQMGQSVLWMAEHPEFGIIGQLFIQLDSDSDELADGRVRAYLYAFRIRPRYRREGLGTFMMHVAEADLIRRSFQGRHP